MMFGYTHMMNGWGYGVMVLLMLALITLVVIGVALLVRHPAPARRGGNFGDGPEYILAERFARGEISSDEYASRQATLRARTSTS